MSFTPRSTSLVHSSSSPLIETVRSCAHISKSAATVLLTGETGTGKEVFARFIHENSPRDDRPFIPVNCGAIPEALLESELFGYVKGAFTGANTTRKGRIAMAEGGTLFLDEVGELPLALQVKLLRVLQEKTYEPVGSSESCVGDFRLVAATNRDLAAEVAAGRFRADLYYRLVVCPIELMPLRRRTQDIPVLFSHFWKARNETRELAAGVMSALVRYEWPGNVRELENVVERISVCSMGSVITLQNLPPQIQAGAVEASLDSASFLMPIEPEVAVTSVPVANATQTELVNAPVTSVTSPPRPSYDLIQAATDLAQTLRLSPVDLPALLRQLEDTFINAALSTSEGNRKAAADMLGLQRTTLVEKLRRREKEKAAPESMIALSA